jgi:hypothetical protein
METETLSDVITRVICSIENLTSALYDIILRSMFSSTASDCISASRKLSCVCMNLIMYSMLESVH